MTLDEQLRRAFDTLRDRLQDEIARQAQSAADELVRSTADHQALHAAQPAAGSTTSNGLVDAARAFGQTRSLSETLDILATSAAHESARAAILLARGGRFSGWRFVGFGSTFDPPSTFDISAGGDATAIAAAVHLPHGREACAVPLVIGGQIVAVLYADEGIGGQRSTTWKQTVEVLAHHAAQRLEALTAIKAARAMIEQPEPASGNHGNGSNDSSDEHMAARRYARLLVSEIKLYHEPDVVAGRRDRDLATRLGGEIARARVLYEQRVGPELRQHVDYFHDELVRTLADGDASLLEAGTSG